jgi:hypothetical protein
MNRKTCPYGTFRDYPKINIFVNGNYKASTTWARTCREAVTEYENSLRGSLAGRVITARFNRSGVESL